LRRIVERESCVRWPSSHRDVRAVSGGLDARHRDRWQLPCVFEGSAQCAALIAPYGLLTDIRMPIMDGIALALAAARDHPNVEILLMTSYADQRERASGLDARDREAVLARHHPQRGTRRDRRRRQPAGALDIRIFSSS
jgi:CheY-like chemotaxis protein